MEKSNHSFLKSLALAFGDGLAFGVAVKLAQGPSKTREETMTDLGPLAERLRNVEDHKEHSPTIDKEALAKFGEGLDGRVLEKVIVALEARLTEHAGQVDRRLAEIDAQVALDLKAVDTHTAAQTSAVEKAIRQIESQVHDYVAAAQQSNAEQIAGVDQRLNALHEALPAKFREIIEAVRQSMEARLALELTEVESRVAAGRVAPERLQELEAKLHGEVEALSGHFSSEMQGLAEHQQSQTAPLQQALQQLETKLTTLREELPPKIRQIVEAVEASMEARIAKGDQQTAEHVAQLHDSIAAVRAEMPSAGSYQHTIDEHLRQHAEQVGALDQKLTVLQEELPPKIKAIVDAVRESLDARMALELKAIEEQHSAQIQQSEARFNDSQQQLRQQLAAESKTPALEQNLEKLQADFAGVTSRLGGLEQHASQSAAGMAASIEQLEARWRADQAAENVPARIQSAVEGLRQSLEAKLATEIRDLEARRPDHSPDLEKALQYASLLEARVQALEQKLQRSADETVDKAVERVWAALESRLQQRAAQAPPPVVEPLQSITGLRQKSTSAEQSVLDLIAGIGSLFEKPGPRAVPPPPAPVPAAHAEHAEAAPAAPVFLEQVLEPGPLLHAEPLDPVAQAPIEVPRSIAQAPLAEPESRPEPVVAHATAPAVTHEAHVHEMPPAAEPPANHQESAVEPMSVASATESVPETRLDEKPPVILFKPKEAGRKWRIPFVSSFLLLTVAIAWLEFL